jgi:DNA-binding NtrC family response regulator
VLWVDDNPAKTRIERRLLRQMGIFAEPVTTNAEAMAVLVDPTDHVDLVITDVARPSGPTGLDLLEDMQSRGQTAAVIAYIGRVDQDRPIPVGLFGMTDRPDDLMNLVMDALDRLPDGS